MYRLSKHKGFFSFLRVHYGVNVTGVANHAHVKPEQTFDWSRCPVFGVAFALVPWNTKDQSPRGPDNETQTIEIDYKIVSCKGSLLVILMQHCPVKIKRHMQHSNVAKFVAIKYLFWWQLFNEYKNTWFRREFAIY